MATDKQHDWRWLCRRRNCRTAIHEAGHATLAIIEARPFDDIVIERGENSNGMIRNLSLRHDDDESVRILLAGIMAVRMTRNRWDEGLFDSAWDDIGFVAEFCKKHDNADPLLLWNLKATGDYLLEYWSPLLAMATSLSRARRISYEDAVREFKANAINSSNRKPQGILGTRGWTPLFDQIKWRMQYPNGLKDVARMFGFDLYKTEV